MASDAIRLPPLDGSVILPEAVDFQLEHNPKEAIYAFSQVPGQITNVTFLEFARACDRVSHYIRPRRSGPDGRVIAIILHADTFLYQTIVVGIMRAGFVPYPISARNSPPAIVHMLKNTSSHDILATQATLTELLGGINEEIRRQSEDWDLRITEMPTLDHIYPKLGSESESDPHDSYPRPSQRPGLDSVALYLHSSGSTGFPKSIPQTHRAVTELASFQIPSLTAYTPRLRVGGIANPPFHIMGFFLHVVEPLYGVLTTTLYPPTVRTPTSLPMVPSPDSIMDHMKRTQTNSTIIIPSVIHTWAQSQEAVDYLKTMLLVGTGGGPLSEKIGQYLVGAGVNIRSMYGATEFGSPTPARKELRGLKYWEWFDFSDKIQLHWEDQGNGTYECRVLTCDTHHPTVENMTNPRGYATSDLFVKHPEFPNLWKLVGRVDDVIIHSSGEKTVPAPMEKIIASSPLVQGVVMFGRERDQAGILVELRDERAETRNPEKLAALRNQIWPFVEEANQVAPTFSRIFKEMILFTRQDKPLPRAGKGTVMRKAALQVYDEEINKLYERVESSAGGAKVQPPAKWEIPTVKEWLRDQASDIQSGKEFTTSRDLFDQGFDSLSATFLRMRIIGALRSSEETARATHNISQDTVYSHPAIDKLAEFICSVTRNPQQAQVAASGKEGIEDIIVKYSAGFDNSPDASGSSVVLLTGSTGNLGSEILAALLKDENVRIVYAFNRRANRPMDQRHSDRFKDRGFDTALLNSTKLRYVEGEMSDDSLGLERQIYDEIQTSVNIIIHTAWRLDFNLTLASFEPYIRGTRNLIDLARQGPHASSLRFLFTSTVASSQSWDRRLGPYPERVIKNPTFAVGGGYGEGKYACERILQLSGLQACSLRIGQLSGGFPNGAWATTDWFPILVKSSIALGGFPEAAGVVSWLPMDIAAQAVLDIAFSETRPPFAINLVHPRPVPWRDIISPVRDAVAQELGRDKNSLPLIPLAEWVRRLETRANDANPDFGTIPAIKLLSFFKGSVKADAMVAEKGGKEMESLELTRFETQKAQEISEAICTVRPLEHADAALWVTYMRTVGFI